MLLKVNINKQKKILILILMAMILGICAGFIFGFISGVKKYPPYNFIKTTVHALFPPQVDVNLENIYISANVDNFIKIKTTNDIDFLRERLNMKIWGEEKLNILIQPEVVMRNYKKKHVDSIDNLNELIKIEKKIEWGIDSIAYHFIPKNGNNELIIYCQGHLGGFELGYEIIQKFINNGYAVLAMSMPLKGENSKPVVYLKELGELKITDHNHLQFIQPSKGHLFRYFLDGVLSFVNYAVKTYKYDRISMLGISGGGWTTTVYAALDSRITRSYPVAGSEPIYVRSMRNGNNWGDYEQIAADIYKEVNYLEMYILGSYGEQRKQLQILNRYDPCCFNGTLYRTYEENVKKHMALLGKGEFEVFLDTHHYEHKISVAALEMIMNDLEHSKTEFKKSDE